EVLLKRKLAICEKSLGFSVSTVASCLLDPGDLYTTENRYTEAEPCLRRALAIYEKLGESGESGVAECLVLLARLYAGKGRHSESEPLLKQAIAILEKTLGPDNPALADSLDDLGV